jgi:hypothetical protein
MPAVAASPSRVPPPLVNAADLQSDYWNHSPSASHATHTGINYDNWKQEIDRTGLQLLQGPHNMPVSPQAPPVTKPTGGLRPIGEQSPPRPHQATIGTFRPIHGSTARPDYGAQLQVLEAKLQAAARRSDGDGRLLPTELFRCVQQSKLEVDDHDIRSAMKRCPPNHHGQLSARLFFETLKAQILASAARPYDFEALEMRGEKDVKFAPNPPVPRHSYNAADLPAQPTGDRGLALLQRRDLVGESHPWHEGGRASYHMLPSCDNARPHRTAANQARALPATGEGADANRERLQRLRFALVNFDRTHCGVLPASSVTRLVGTHGGLPCLRTAPRLPRWAIGRPLLRKPERRLGSWEARGGRRSSAQAFGAFLIFNRQVTQFAKLHGVWPGNAQWQQVLVKFEPRGMTRRVDYVKLLQHLAR